MHILQIIIKNTSTMDFTLPIFRAMRKKNPNVRLSILYCVFDKRQILRKSKFYGQSFKEFGVQEYDFADFIKKMYRWGSFFLRPLFSVSSADKIHFRELFFASRKNNPKFQILNFIKSLFKSYTVKSLFSSIIANILVVIERRIGPRLIELDNILPKLNPDVILFDNRAKTTFYGRDQFYEYFEETKKPVVLIPHGPHFRDPVSEFCPFDEQGHPLPDYCDYWMPLRFGTPWLSIPNHRDQFAITGYPGFDSGWLNFLMPEKASANFTYNNQGSPNERKCLFITRRYLPSGEKRGPELDPFIIDYEDFLESLSTLAKAVDMCGSNVQIIIKPHPANNYKILAEDIKKIGLKNWTITYEPIYALLSEIDMVVAFFSTVLLVPAIAGIPTILLNSKAQQHLHKQWDLLEKMFSNLQFYMSDINDVPRVFSEIVQMLEQRKSDNFDSDVNHLRYFFPDGATENAIERIEKLTEESERSITSSIKNYNYKLQ